MLLSSAMVNVRCWSALLALFAAVSPAAYVEPASAPAGGYGNATHNAMIELELEPVLELTVPCYNEELRFPRQEFVDFAESSLAVAAERRRASDGSNTSNTTAATAAAVGQLAVRFLFVNDGSSDGTLALLQALVAEFPLVFRVLNLQQNVGKAEAVRLGMLHLSLIHI